MKKKTLGLFAWVAALGLGLRATPARAESVATYILHAEPAELNSMKTTDSYSAFVLGHTNEGLARFSPKSDGSLVPGVAEAWTVTARGAVFKLRKNAKWSDGKPVTARDFIFAWKTAVDPRTASPYATLLFPIRNAEAIAKGQKAELGVQAPNDFELEVQFEKPCAYFASLTAFPTYFPVRQDFFEAHRDRLGADAADLLSNGPFTLKAWNHGASLTLAKNPTYWDATSVHLDRVEVPYITSDSLAKFNFFKDGKADLVQLSRDTLPLAIMEHAQIRSFADGTVWFLLPNFRAGHPLANRKLREAVALRLADRAHYIDRVIGIPGTKPALGIVPSSIRGMGQAFTAEFPISVPKADLDRAKHLVEAARAELGGTIAPLHFLTGDSPVAMAEAQYFAAMLRQVGLELRIDTQIFKQKLAKMTAGEFDLAEANWMPDFPDPITYLEVMASWNPTNRGQWKNAKYDALIRQAEASSDPKARMRAMGAADRILIDDLGVIPLYENDVIWLQNPKLTGVVRRSFGPDPDFRGARKK